MPFTMYSYFMDVGQGDCTYIELWDEANSKYFNMLVDFGYKERQFTGEHPADSTLMVLVNLITKISKKQGLDYPLLDHLFVTHPDTDHWNMLAALVTGTSARMTKNLWEEKGYKKNTKLTITKLTYGGQTKDYEVTWYKKFWWGIITGASGKIDKLADKAHDAMDNNGNVTPSWSYLGALDIFLLASNIPKKTASAANPKSLVLMLKFNTQKLLLLGDAEPTDVYPSYIKKWYATDLSFLNCKAIKLAHHGSRKGTPDWWAAVTKPQVAFVSGDYFWSHPYNEAIFNIQQANTIDPNVKLQHWMTSYSDFLTDYNPENITKGIFSSIWYVVTSKSAKAKDAKGNEHTYTKGLYTGASFLMEWYDDGRKPAFAFAPDDVWPGPTATVKRIN